LASLGLAILLGRLVSKTAYGTYQYLLSWGAVLSLASITGLSDAVVQAVARGFDRTIFLSLRTRLKWSLLGTAVAAVIGIFELATGRTELGIGFFIIGVFLPTSATLTVWSDYLVGKKRFDLQSLITTGGALAVTALLALTALIRPQPLALVGTFCLAWAAIHVIALIYTLKKLPPKGEADPKAIAYGFKLSGLDVLSNIATYLDRLLIFNLLGAQPMAVYAFAIAPVEHLKGYLKSLYIMALPKVASRPLPEIKKTFFRKFWLMTGVVATGIAVYIALAPFAFHLLFPKYPEAIWLSQIYALGLLGTASILPTAIFTGHKRFKENTAFQVGTSIFNIVSLVIFIPWLGLWGAVLARVVTRLAGVVYGIVLTRKVFRAE
jgi:O-antigen/teichoic acid export membrane protein